MEDSEASVHAKSLVDSEPERASGSVGGWDQKLDHADKNIETLNNAQEIQATYAGIGRTQNLTGAGTTKGLSPQGTDLASVGENVTRRIDNDEEGGKHGVSHSEKHKSYARLIPWRYMVNRTSASAPENPYRDPSPSPKGKGCVGMGPGHHQRSNSLDDVLQPHKLLKDVQPKSSLHENKLEDNKLARASSFRFNGPSESEAVNSSTADSTGFESGRRRYTILSMDGGGMRGLIGARILAHLESLLKAKIGKDVKLCDYFDFLAGTSTGAILTLMLNTPDEKGEPLFTAQGCCEFYSIHGRNIFRPRWYDPFRGRLRQLYRPKYSSKSLERLLKSYLIRDGKVLTMRNTLKPYLVTSFDISQATPHIFLRFSAMKDDSRNFNLWEVCRGTAAAPTYFKPAEVMSTDGKVSVVLIDGGAIQNNPSLVAMTHVLGNNEEFPDAAGLPDLLILSLGAGQLDEKHELKKARKWGMTGWVRPLLNIMMDGSSDTVDYQIAAGFAGHNCSENYLRIQISGLPNNTSLMDCTTKENIRDLVDCADDLLRQKAVMGNTFGEKVILDTTYAERLSWFADQLIAQKKLRERDTLPISQSHHRDPGSGLGPAGRLVSPMNSHLFLHKQMFANDFADDVHKAKSFRF